MVASPEPTNLLGLPHECFVDRRVFKKLFHEKLRLGVADRRALTDDVESIVWRYAVKPDHVALAAVRDETLDFAEIAVLRVDLRSPARVERIEAMVHRAIPYPVLLEVRHDEQSTLSTAVKRVSESDRSSVVVERVISSAWIAQAAPDVAEAFLASLLYAEIPASDLRELYDAYSRRILALLTANRTGRFEVDAERTVEQQREALDRIDRIEQAIRVERGRLDKERQFNRKVDLNTRIKSLEADLSEARASLRSEYT